MQAQRGDAFPIWVMSGSGGRRRHRREKPCLDAIDDEYLKEYWDETLIADIERHGKSLMQDTTEQKIIGVALLRSKESYSGVLCESMQLVDCRCMHLSYRKFQWLLLIESIQFQFNFISVSIQFQLHFCQCRLTPGRDCTG